MTCKLFSLIFTAAALFATANNSYLDTLKNPVARCADAGVMFYRGNYYISGVGLPGQFLISSDLIHWQGPFDFFHTNAKWIKKNDEKEMHAPGLRYINGKIHFYWNGIGYAFSTNPLANYKELPKRFDREIDPFLFADDDGKLYFYTVKYTDGNEIYGQKMYAPDKLIGKPVPLITAIPNSWEWRDWKVNEGPEVVKHNYFYYLLYAANVTSIEMANYAIGCATAKSPLAFSNDTKYPWPVMEPSYERIFDEVKTIIPQGAFGAHKWYFTTNAPPKNWTSSNFLPDKNWKKSFCAFGSPIRNKSAIQNVYTLWNTTDIWLRSAFALPNNFSTNLQLVVRHLDSAEFYINGLPAYSNALWAGPRLVPISQATIASLHPGTNTIAVHCRSARNEKYLDVGLIDPGDKQEDDIVWNTGQPNILRGPNGFEWFVIYFAMWNEGPHSQGINRVHFFGDELFIDGPTGANPRQYNPPPSLPTFSTNKLQISGNYRLPVHPAENYLFEVWLKPQTRAEIYTWRADKNNFQKIFFAPESNSLVCSTTIKNKTKNLKFPLQNNFDFSVFHKIRFEKNANSFNLIIDDTNLTRDKLYKIPYNKKGVPGFIAKKNKTVFDGIIFTIGWDEFDNKISGWKKINNNNLKISVKGDELNNYDFSTQIYLNNFTNGRAGIIPVYFNDKNFLAVYLTPEKIEVAETTNGHKIIRYSKNLSRRERLYFRGKKPIPPDDIKISASHCWKFDSPIAAADGVISRYSRENIPKTCFWDHRGTKEWIKYNFQSTKIVDCCEVIWYDDIKDGGDCATPESWQILYKNKTGKWMPVKLINDFAYETKIDKLNFVKFQPVKTTSLKLIVKSKRGRGAGLYEWTAFNSQAGGREETGDLYLKRSAYVSEMNFIFDARPPYTLPKEIFLQYKTKNNIWKKVDIISKSKNKLKFKKIFAKHFKFKALIPPGNLYRIIRAYANVERQSAYNIRAVKLFDKVIIFLDGRQIFKIPCQPRKSKVGIITENCDADFNTISCFNIK